MLVLVCGDTHYGARQDNPNFYEYQKKFFHKVLFPFIEKNNIKHVVHLGDLVESRKSIHYNSLKRMREDFINPLCDMKDVSRYWLVGNHDSHYKTNLTINAQSEFLVDQFANYVISKPCHTVFEDHGERMLFVPWICPDNREECENMIQESQARFCFGHLELSGFMNGSQVLKHGDDRSLFKNFNLVLSGHIHTRSAQDNIRYVGSTFQYNWGDYGEYRGFCVLNTETGKINYYKNPFKLFSIIEYSDGEVNYVDGDVKDTYCRIMVNSKSNEVKFNDFVKKIEDIGVIDLTIIDESVMKLMKVSEEVKGDNLQILISDYIDNQELANPEIIKDEMGRLFKIAEGK